MEDKLIEEFDHHQVAFALVVFTGLWTFSLSFMSFDVTLYLLPGSTLISLLSISGDKSSVWLLA